MSHNPVRGVKRPKFDAHEGKTPALGDGQARALLEAPPSDTLKGKRDRAILATFLHHGLRCEELCALRVRDLQSRQGVPHLRIFGKGAKVRYVPAHPLALERIHAYLKAVANGSVVSWQHINLLGEYDFSDEKLRDSVGIKPPNLTA